MDASISVIKLLSRKQISRELFKVCRLHSFETLAQIENYFSEHGSFDKLKWCAPEEEKELETLIGAEVKRLVVRWQLPPDLLESPSVVHTFNFLLKKDLLSERHLKVLQMSFRIYQDSSPMTPSEVAAAMDLTERSVRRLRKRSLEGITEGIRSLQAIRDDLHLNYGLDLNSPLLFIDEQCAKQINFCAGTNFSPHFLAVLLGEYLQGTHSRLGNSEEVLAGNFLGVRHYWSSFYLLRKEITDVMDLEALVKDCFRLMNNGSDRTRTLDLKTFVSHFVIHPDTDMDLLAPPVAEILNRELGLTITKGRLSFPPKKQQFLVCSYSRQALISLKAPSRLEVIRQKIEELHPEVFVDPIRFDLVLLDKWGFTSYNNLYGLKKWFSGGKLKDQSPELLKDLAEKFPSKTGDYWKQYWEQRFADLNAFTDTHGRQPEKDGPAQEKELWDWLKRQREQYRQAKLDTHQQALYEEFRERFPVRSGKYWQLLWNKRFQELKDFTKTHSRLPGRSATGEEKRLYRWYKAQRVFMKKGELDIDQKVLLREFSDRYPLQRRSAWEVRYRKLKQFAEQHYRLPAQNGEAEEEKTLNYFWLCQLERMNQGKLLPEQKALLKDLKQRFPYNAEHHKLHWDERFEELKEYAETHGVPQGHKCTGQAKTLRGWLIAQRIRSKKGELDSRQHRLLKQFDEQYDLTGDRLRKAEWDKKFGELEALTEAKGRLPKLEVEEEKVIYRWFVTQRTQLKAAKLDPRQKELIIEFMDRNPLKTAAYREARWFEKLAEVQGFAESHSRLPLSTEEEERPLYRWISIQQRKGKLNSLQQKRLQELLDRYPVKNQLEEHWQLRFGELKLFVTAHSRLPKRKASDKERSLYYWSRMQLKRLEKGKLNPNQIGMLVQLSAQINP